MSRFFFIPQLVNLTVPAAPTLWGQVVTLPLRTNITEGESHTPSSSFLSLFLLLNFLFLFFTYVCTVFFIHVHNKQTATSSSFSPPPANKHLFYIPKVVLERTNERKCIHSQARAFMRDRQQQQQKHETRKS